MVLAAYAGALSVLLGASRGQIYGAISGLEFRYLTDVVCAATLALGLACSAGQFQGLVVDHAQLQP